MNEKNQKKPKNSPEEITVKVEEPAKETPGETGKAKEPAEGGPKEPSPLATLQTQVEEKTREAAENFDKWLRSVAELENFKKRTQKEKADLLKFGNESLLKALLPVLDNLERAINHGRKAEEKSSLLEGVEITYKQFLNILERFGIKPISAAGEVFDPEKHEAISQEQSDQEPNRVISEVEKGYVYHDRLLRPSKVIVSKAMPSKEG